MVPAAADVGVESFTWINNWALLLCVFSDPLGKNGQYWSNVAQRMVDRYMTLTFKTLTQIRINCTSAHKSLPAVKPRCLQFVLELMNINIDS
jgi:hypothetical protein